MVRGYVWFGVLVVGGYCATIASAVVVYDDGGVHELIEPVYEDIQVFDSIFDAPTTLIVLEGADTSDIDIFDHSIFRMIGGEIGDGSLSLHNFSWGEISAGIMQDDPLDVYDQSQLHITGSFSSTGLRVQNDGQVFIYGTNFFLDGVPVGYGQISEPLGALTGTMPNGQLELFFDRRDNATITLVPEPVSLSLLLLGTVWLRKKRNEGKMP